MKKIILLILILICSFTYSHAEGILDDPSDDRKLNEVAWSAILAKNLSYEGGEAVTEYRLPAGARVDIYTDDVAWEVEWCKKWPESIGQALYYASATNKKPGIWLLKEQGDDENWNECLAVINYLRGKGIDLEFRTQVVK